eukprot:235205-Chlamydomonas_euryale.AAC.1
MSGVSERQQKGYEWLRLAESTRRPDSLTLAMMDLSASLTALHSAAGEVGREGSNVADAPAGWREEAGGEVDPSASLTALCGAVAGGA